MAPAAGEYKIPLDNGMRVVPALFETFGGFSPAFFDLLRDAGAHVENRLTSAQYDETTWSARSWMSFATQQISVALHRAVAWEAAHALGARGLGSGRDPRGTLPYSLVNFRVIPVTLYLTLPNFGDRTTLR